jgi:hypothetical protein
LYLSGLLVSEEGPAINWIVPSCCDGDVTVV